MSLFSKLEDVELEYQRLSQRLQEPGVADNSTAFQKLMREHAELEKVVVVYQEFKKKTAGLKSSKDLLASTSDEEIKIMAKEDIDSLQSDIAVLEPQLKVLLLPKDPHDDKNIILELRAGAGGDEAGLFAEELFRAYTIYAAEKSWAVRIISISEGNAGGYKEVIASFSGNKVYSFMKYESGVHRVQRVPKTESQGRVHTSTITVAVIPEVEIKEISVNNNDLRIDTYRSSGNGGQSVNTTDSAVRVTHIPSGLVVTCQDGKSQLSNKEQALKVLYSRLQSMEEDGRRKEASEERLSQIGTGDRSERIRTYNFPQSRVTDHRIGFTTHALGAIMDGGLTEVVDPVIMYFQSEALKRQA